MSFNELSSAQFFIIFGAVSDPQASDIKPLTICVRLELG